MAALSYNDLVHGKIVTVSYHDPVRGQTYHAIFRCIVRVTVSYHDPVHGQKYPAIVRCIAKVTLSYRDAVHGQKYQCHYPVHYNGKSILP